MILSPFNPIFFLGKRKACGEESPSMQVFAASDQPIMQVICPLGTAAPSCKLRGFPVAEDICDLIPASCNIGEEVLYIYTLPVLTKGCYFIAFEQEEIESEPFRITDDEEELEDTVLIRYSPADNTGRKDVVGKVGNTRFVFSFRVQGGFKDDGHSFSVDNEQFVTPESDIVELYGRESTQCTLTVGHCNGVPIWFGELLNRLLTCRLVFIDGLRYARYQQSVPEIQQTQSGVNSFVFSQQLQRVKYLTPQSL